MVHEYKYWSCYCKQRPWSHVMLWWPLKITTCMKQLLCSHLVTCRSGPVLTVWPVRPWWYHFPSRTFGWECCTSKLTLTSYVAIFYSKSPKVCIIHVLISFAHDFILLLVTMTRVLVRATDATWRVIELTEEQKCTQIIKPTRWN